MKYSIIIPAHNEAENLENFIQQFIGELAALDRYMDYEIIIVENGSTDNTLKAAQLLEKRNPEIIRVLSNKRGSYGEAIKRGMLESRGNYLSVLECDFLDAGFVAKSIELFCNSDARFIVASKRHPQSIDCRPIKRRILTKLFNYIINLAIGYPGSDTHGLKSIEVELARQLCEIAETTDEIFQTEIVLLAWRHGIEILELPIRIEEVRAATVSVRRRFPMVLNLIQQVRHSLNRYSTLKRATVLPRTVEI